jgi:phage portal protein BeeE
LATQYEQELERKLIPENKKGSQYFKHNFNSLMRASASERMNFFTQGINNGIISPNEARRYEDMEGFQGGDKRYINAANIPVDQIEEWIAAKISNLNKTNMINNPEGENNNEQ